MAKLTLKDLKNLQEDEELDLSAMQLTEFPLALPMVSRLSTVDLSQNSIAFLPNEICKMNRLIRLDLGKNRIHHLPNDIGNLTSLQHLNLQGNDIEELPLSFANLKSLKWLDLRNNPLEDKLAKAAGNCGNDKECQAAAKNVLNFVSERKKFIEYQKEKENKVNEKIKLKNVEEKKKAAKANGNAKSNAQKETSSTKATTANAPVNNHNEKGAKKTPTHARKSAARQEENRSNQQRGFFSRVIRAIFLLAYYSAFAVLGAATVSILFNCSSGGTEIAGSKPLCADLTKLSQFQKPSPRFFNNVVNTYGVVLRGYRRQANSVINPVSKTIQAQWKEFGKSKFGAHVQQYVYKVHAFVAEKLIIAQTFVSKKINEVITWYNNGGDKQVAEILEPVKTVLLIIVEVVRDVALHVYEGIVYVAGRAQQFVHIWLEKGFQAALKTLN